MNCSFAGAFIIPEQKDISLHPSLFQVSDFGGWGKQNKTKKSKSHVENSLFFFASVMTILLQPK